MAIVAVVLTRDCVVSGVGQRLGAQFYISHRPLVQQLLQKGKTGRNYLKNDMAG